jgi:hypothetical protein
MSKVINWLDHRMEVVELSNWMDLSETSGVSQEVMRDMRTCGSLQVLSR